jgi:hypothetical protein
MFQYAAARCLAEARFEKLQLDLGWFDFTPRRSAETSRHYGLREYSLSLKTDCISTNWQGSLRRRIGLKHPLLNRALLYRRITDNQLFGFNESFFATRGHTILDGYFQHSKYFRPIEKQLREDFQPLTTLNEPWRSLAYRLMNLDSVVMHIRRGDYVTNTEAAQYHGTPGVEYYKKAMECHLKRYQNSQFFCFSDDLVWCQQNIIHPRIEFVDTGSLSAPLVLHLMSKAKHHIIANSSFSWWAGWLNNNPEKIVWCPEYWVKNIKTSDTGLLYNQSFTVVSS